MSPIALAFGVLALPPPAKVGRLDNAIELHVAGEIEGYAVAEAEAAGFRRAYLWRGSPVE